MTRLELSGMTIAKLRSVFCVDHIKEDVVHIRDLDVGMSVTNDAENVVEYLYNRFGNRRFFYRDTMGRWDELVHEHGKFTGFRPSSS